MRRPTGVGHHGPTFYDLIGTHDQQDVDLDKLFSDVAAYSERVMGPAHVGNAVDEAVKTAISRRTVAHLTIPKDIQEWSADDQRSKANIPRHSGDLYSDPLPLPSRTLLDKAASVIAAGSKIAILAGRGCLGAKSELLQLAEMLSAPIVKPLLGKGVVPDDHTLTSGGIGLLGTALSQEVLETCDTLIIAGSSFPYWSFVRNLDRLGPFRSIWMRPASAFVIPSKWDWWAIAGTCFAPCCPSYGRTPIAVFSKRRRGR